MNVYQIQIAGSLCEELKLQKKLTHSNEQKAINTLTKALEQNEIKFSIVKERNKTSFLNESGGELAAVVPV